MLRIWDVGQGLEQDRWEKEVGLGRYYVGGWYNRLVGTPPFKEANHWWNVFRFENDLFIPADATWSSGYLRQPGTKRSGKSERLWFILPRKHEDWEMFLAMYWGNKYTDGKGITGIDLDKVHLGAGDILTKLSFQQWESADSSYLKAVVDARLNGDPGRPR